MQHEHFPLQRTLSYQITTSKKITPSNNLTRSSSVVPADPETKPLVPKSSCEKTQPWFLFLLRSLVSFRTCRWLTAPRSLPLGRKVTGTLFGRRRGHISFSIQDDPGSNPVLLVELALSTSTLVNEMASGHMRIALECNRPIKTVGLFHEPEWTMYCNGKRCGRAVTWRSGGLDRHVLGTLRSVSVGAGVIPVAEGEEQGELLYMRARFERVVGGQDSEAFYMLNPDGNGVPELSIFLMRV